MANINELNEEQLEKVSGGTIYHVECTNCGWTPNSDGNFTDYYWAAQAMLAYSKSPCPGCGATYMIEKTTIED